MIEAILTIWGLYWLLRLTHILMVCKDAAGKAAAFGASLADPYLLLIVVQALLTDWSSVRSASWFDAVALLATVIGFGFICAAHWTLDGYYRPAIMDAEPKTLIMTGVYSVVRHPIYFGSFLMGLATSFALNGVYGLLVLVTLPFVASVARSEESRLEQTFGEARVKIFRLRTPDMLIPFVY